MGFWKKTFLGPTTIRWSLVRNIALLLLVTGAAILGATLWFAQGTVESLSRTLIQRATSRTDGELHAFFSLPEANLKMARRWGRKGLLRAGDKKGLNALFIPLMRTCPQVSSVMVANDTGVEHLILRKKDGWLVRVVRVDEWGSKAQWTLYDMEGNKKKAYWKELKYDPRKRPWYQGARRHKATTEPFWTKPYTFFTTKDPGITAAMTWQRREGGASKEAGALHHVVGYHVVGYDLLLTDISKFTTRIQVSKNGKAFVLTPDGQVVGLPSHPRFNDPASVKEAVLKPASKLGIPAVAAAVEAWKKRDRPQRFFSFSQGGETWWVGFKRFSVGPHRSFWIAVVVPESDFTGEIHRQRNIILGIMVVALVVAVGLGFWLARRYSRPLEALARQSQRIQDLDLTPTQAIDSGLAEVQHLAASQEQMRAALESFSRYVPIEVVRELIRRGEVARIGGKVAPITILFSDIRGFTTISENLAPDDLADHMADYFALLLEILHGRRATVDKFIGDAILAFWGAPSPDTHLPEEAVRAALECVQTLEAHNKQWRAQGRTELPTCFGIHTGEVVVGNIGAPSRLSYTVLGDAVNLASRLEALNRLYGTSVLISEDVRDPVQEAFHLRLVDRVAVKGKIHPVQIYEVLGERGEVDEERLAFAQKYEEAFQRYQDQEFTQAVAALEDILEQGLSPADDPSVTRLLEACRRLEARPPGPGWDGVVRLKKK